MIKSIYILTLVYACVCGAVVFADTGTWNPGTPAQVSAPAPGMIAASPYRQLSISVGEAQGRITELKNLSEHVPAQDLMQPVEQYCEWLGNLADEHNRLAATFGRTEGMKTHSEAEKQMGSKFSRLKNQALLLKAQLLVRQSRYPEAVGPLVEIVNAEPRSSTGQEAYRYLKDIGFSEDIDAPASKAAGEKASAAVKKTGDSVEIVKTGSASNSATNKIAGLAPPKEPPKAAPPVPVPLRPFGIGGPGGAPPPGGAPVWFYGPRQDAK